MKAVDILNDAAVLVDGRRAEQYGDKAENFKRIACLWSAYLGVPITSVDAAQMLALLKMARAKSGIYVADNFVDQAGYAGIAGELANEIPTDPVDL